jgi:golgi to ER traffic protein 4
MSAKLAKTIARQKEKYVDCLEHVHPVYSEDKLNRRILHLGCVYGANCIRIAEGQFYEAHQQLRVIASRYLKASDYASAADILSNGSILLLKAGQGGSGGDLAMMLLNEVYSKGAWECTEANKTRLVEILQAFPKDEPTRKRFVQEMIGWSGKIGDVERGDPDLHHAAGVLYAEGQWIHREQQPRF